MQSVHWDAIFQTPNWDRPCAPCSSQWARTSWPPVRSRWTARPVHRWWPGWGKAPEWATVGECTTVNSCPQPPEWSWVASWRGSQPKGWERIFCRATPSIRCRLDFVFETCSPRWCCCSNPWWPIRCDDQADAQQLYNFNSLSKHTHNPHTQFNWVSNNRDDDDQGETNPKHRFQAPKNIFAWPGRTLDEHQATQVSPIERKGL